MKKRPLPAYVIFSILSILSLLLISCVSSIPTIDCDSERIPSMENNEGRNCFYAAYEECRPAQYEIGYQTHEGIDKHELTISGKEEGVCKVKHIAEIRYSDKTYQSICSLVKEDKGGKIRFRLVDCQGEEATEVV